MQRAVAYSEQHGAMDDIRRDSILRRHTHGRGAPVGAPRRDPRRLRAVTHPGAPHLSLLPRVCVPSPRQTGPLGFLWFIDSGPAMAGEQIAQAAAAAPALALALFHESLATGLASHRELEAVTGLLLGEPDSAGS